MLNLYRMTSNVAVMRWLFDVDDPLVLHDGLTNSAAFCFRPRMPKLTPAYLGERFRAVLMRYTPEALKGTPTDELIAERIGALDGLEVIGFTKARDQQHSTGPKQAATRAAITRKRLNEEALKRVAREATTAVLAICEVRQRKSTRSRACPFIER